MSQPLTDQAEAKQPFGCYCNKWHPYRLFTHHELCPRKVHWENHVEELKQKQLAFRLPHLPSMTVTTSSLGGRLERTRLRVEIADLAATIVTRSAKVAAVLLCLERVVNFFGPHSKRVDELMSELEPVEQNLLREMLQLQQSLNKTLHA